MTVALRRLQPADVDHERLWLFVGALVVVALTLFSAGVAVPSLSCPFKLITGLPCLGCGTTRALQSAMSGDLAAAVRLNPLAATAASVWALWSAYAAVVIAFGLPRLRWTSSTADLLWMRWVAASTTVATWVFLIIDGR